MISFVTIPVRIDDPFASGINMESGRRRVIKSAGRTLLLSDLEPTPLQVLIKSYNSSYNLRYALPSTLLTAASEVKIKKEEHGRIDDGPFEL